MSYDSSKCECDYCGKTSEREITLLTHIGVEYEFCSEECMRNFRSNDYKPMKVTETVP